MSDLTSDSDRLINEGRILRNDNRSGGRHRREVSIGQESQRIKRRHWGTKIRNVILALFAIWIGAGVLGVILNGIGFVGVMALVIASIVAIGVLGNYPKLKTPKRADINKGDVKTLVGRTELWLEAQRPALPPPAVNIIDQIGVQLDGAWHAA